MEVPDLGDITCTIEHADSHEMMNYVGTFGTKSLTPKQCYRVTASFPEGTFSNSLYDSPEKWFSEKLKGAFEGVREFSVWAMQYKHMLKYSLSREITKEDIQVAVLDHCVKCNSPEFSIYPRPHSRLTMMSVYRNGESVVIETLLDR